MSKHVGLNVFGYLTAELGVGQSGRNLIRALRRDGFPVRGIDIGTADARSGRVLGWDETFGDWSEVEQVIDLIHCNAPELTTWANRFPDAVANGNLKVNMSYWELPRLLPNWADQMRRMDALLAPTRFIQSAIEQADTGRPVLHIPQQIDPGERHSGDRARWGLPADGTLFLAALDVGSDPSRKNPMAAIRAFEMACEAGALDAHLVVKIAHHKIHAETEALLKDVQESAARNDRILLFFESIPQDELPTFFASFDAFISLHRSEGLGLVLMEMMALAKPVITTAFSGNMDFCTPNNCVLIGYDEVPVEANEPQYQRVAELHPDCRWAEARIQEAADAIVKVATDPAWAADLGERAREDMIARDTISLAPVVTALAEIEIAEALHTALAPSNTAKGTTGNDATGNDATGNDATGEENWDEHFKQQDWGYRWAQWKRRHFGTDIRLLGPDNFLTRRFGRNPATPKPLPPEFQHLTPEHGSPVAGFTFDNQALLKRGIPPGIDPDPLAQPHTWAYAASGLPDLSHLPAAAEDRTLLVIVGHLQANVFYAGYSVFFDALRQVAPAFDRMVVGVVADVREPALVQHCHPVVEVCAVGDLGQTLTAIPRLTACNGALLHWETRRMLPTGSRVLYYCLERDDVFHLPGPLHNRCKQSILEADHLVVSTGLLADDLAAQGLLRPETHLFISHPEIRPITSVRPGEHDRSLFFYFRPEQHNLRNMAAEVWDAALAFAKRHADEGWTLYLLGTVGTSLSAEVAGNTVMVLPKLPAEDYLAILSRVRAAVALIDAPHPGVIAFQTAASGIPTVTNIHANRDADTLRDISRNLVPWDPLRQSLVDRVEAALEATHGVPDFHPARYNGTGRSFSTPPASCANFGAFVDAVLRVGEE